MAIKKEADRCHLPPQFRRDGGCARLTQVPVTKFQLENYNVDGGKS